MSTSRGEPTLEEETGKSWSAGLVWDVMDNLSLTADYYDIEREGAVTTLSSTFILDAEAGCRTGLTRTRQPYAFAPDSAFCQNIYPLVERQGGTATGSVLRLNQAYINAAVVDTSGIDATWSYTLDTDRWGTFNTELGWSIVLTDKSKQFDTDPLVDYRDDADLDSRSRARGSLTWSKGDWSTTVFGTRIGTNGNNAGANFTNAAGGFSGRRLQPYMTYKGFPAVEIQVLRAEHDDSLTSAKIMQQWISEVQPTLPDGMHMHVYFESWKHLRDRIETLMWNGITGLILVIITLFYFLNARVAWWVTVGIPVSFLATLGVLLFMGGTINMISLFGLILALGIIVDDAIVVGEDTLTHLQQGESPLRAAIGGARRMFWPVMASSMTTIAAFLPLAMMGGAMGKIAFDIPFVMICVIIASLVECFLILPGHLHHSFARASSFGGALRERLDRQFDDFREQRFRPMVRWAIERRYAVVTAAFCAFFLALTIVITGWLKFTFFPPVDGDQLRAVAEFSAGTDQRTVDRFLNHLETTLHETDAEFDEDIVETVVQMHRTASGFQSIGGSRTKLGDHYGTLLVEVWTGNARDISNVDFIDAWREKIIEPPGLELLTISQPEAGPPGSPVALRLGGADISTLKAASLEIQDALSRFNGISNVEDDLPWGKEQLTFELTPDARALGLTLASVAAQLRSAFDGSLAQLFNEQDEEVEVRVMLPDSERGSLSALDRMPIIAPNGDTLLLSDVVTFSSRQGVDLLRRVDGRLSVVVSASLDPEQGNANQIIAALTDDILPDIKARYHISVDVEGKLKEQAESMRDVQTGQMLALALIYIILAWVFASWSWPIAIMTAIMFGFTGAVIGHLFMGLFGVKFSMFSIMGLFGLAGIIVNDSIVLVSFFRQLVGEGMDRLEAIVEACVRRLRAVLLTSITTVAGLAPILLETSLQAQFLKPMAVSLVFGLSFGTVLILLVVPSMLMIIEETKPRLAHFAARLGNAMIPSHLPATVLALWQFDPKQYRRAAEPEPGLRGSLWWPTALLGLYAFQLLQQSGVIVRAVQASGVSLTVLLALALLILLDQYPRNSFRGTAHQFATAIGADALQARVCAIGAKGAFKRANPRFQRLRRQVAVAAFAVGAQLEHGVPRWAV